MIHGSEPGYYYTGVGLPSGLIVGRSSHSEFVLLFVDEEVNLLNEWMCSGNDDMLRRLDWGVGSKASYKLDEYSSQ